MLRLLLAALLASPAAALLSAPAHCASRIAASRLAAPAAAARVARTVRMCDAEPPAEAAAEAPAEAAEAAAPAEAAAAPAERKKPRGGNKTPLEDLVEGAEVEGKIRSVMAYGAFVDIGAATDGLLHVSEIANEFIKDANDKLTAGETVTCRIKSINLEKKQLALSCKDPNAAPAPRRGGGGKKVDLSEYESADIKAYVTGKVNSITDFGAFVTLKEGVDGLVHISQIKEGGVGKVEDELSVGQEVQVRVVQCDKAKRRIGLSMLEYKEGDEERAKGGGRQRSGGFGGGGGFGEEDAPFKMKEEELEALAEGEFSGSSFEAAFERAALVEKARAAKERFSRQLL